MDDLMTNNTNELYSSKNDEEEKGDYVYNDAKHLSPVQTNSPVSVSIESSYLDSHSANVKSQ